MGQKHALPPRNMSDRFHLDQRTLRRASDAGGAQIGVICPRGPGIADGGASGQRRSVAPIPFGEMLFTETSIDDLGDIFRLGSCLYYKSGSIRDEIYKWALRANSPEWVFCGDAPTHRLPQAYRSHSARLF